MKPYGMITKLLVVALMLMGTFMAPQSLYAQCVPPPSGMVAWWPLDETSGPTAHDLAGVDNAGTWMNNPTPVSGKVAGALCFDGNNYVEVGNDPEINFGVGDLTIDAWVKRNTASTPSPPSVIIDKRDGSDIGYCLAVSYGRLVFRMSGTNYLTTTSLVPADGLWHFIAVTVHRATGGGRFYCDGIPRDTFTPLSSSLNNTNPLRIGKGYLSGNQPWLGCIDELELFNRALDSLEVRSIWAADSLGKCKDTCHADGDANHDGVGLTTADTTYLAQFIRACGPAPVPLHSCDLNGDGFVNLADLQLYHLYFIFGRSIFDPYGGYPVPCPCDPIPAPVPDTVNIFGLEHSSLGMACLDIVGDTLVVSRLGETGNDGFITDMRDVHDRWTCVLEDFDADSSLPLGATITVSVVGEVDGVPDQPIGSMSETKVGANKWKLRVDYGASSYTLRIYNGENLVFEQSGIPADYFNNCPWLRWPWYWGKEGCERWDQHDQCKANEHKSNLVQTIVAGYGHDGDQGYITFEELNIYNMPMTFIEIEPENPEIRIGPLSSVSMTTVSIPELHVGEVSAHLAIGPLHNRALDYLSLHNPLQGERVFVSLEEYNQMMDTVVEYLVNEVGLEREVVDSAVAAIPTMAEMGMLFDMNGTTYIGAPVVTNEYIPYVMQYLVDNGLTTQAVADEINTVNNMIVDEEDPDSILAYIVDVLPDLGWNAEEQIGIDAFSQVYAYSYGYWNSEVESKGNCCRWLWVALCDAGGGLMGGVVGEGIGGPLGGVIGAVVVGALASDLASSSLPGLVAPRDSVMYGDPPRLYSALGSGALDLAGGDLVVYNRALDGEYGVEMDLGEAPRFDAVWNDVDPDSIAPNGAYFTMTKYGGGDGFSNLIASTSQAVKSDGEWGISADFSEVGATIQSLVAILGDSVVAFETGYVEPIIWWPRPPNDDHWPWPWPKPHPWPFPDLKGGAKAGTGSNGCFPTHDDPLPFVFPELSGKGIADIVLADCIGMVPEDDDYEFDYLSRMEFRLSGVPQIIFTSITTTGCCQGMRGNVNDDPDDMVDISDVVYLINYLFKGGAVPPCMEEANANGDPDNLVNVGDVVYLINYLFKGGLPPLPCSGKSGDDLSSASRLSDTPGHAQISLVLNQADRTDANVPALSKTSPEAKDKVFQISVVGKSDRDVAGVQLEIGFDPGEVTMLDPALTPLTKNLQLYASIKDGVQKIGILDLTGENLIPAGQGTMVILRVKGVVQGSPQEDLSSIKINKAVMVDKDAMPLALELSGELKQEEAKSEMVKVSESKPMSFSLSQNYPNPFNPETDISYALPTECNVKLTIYNVAGQKVRTLVDEHQTAGFKTIHWNGKDNEGKELASGVYFYKIQAGAFTDARKMILMK